MRPFAKKKWQSDGGTYGRTHPPIEMLGCVVEKQERKHRKETKRQVQTLVNINLWPEYVRWSL